MPIDPDNPSTWLRKLPMTAAQIDPSDYPEIPNTPVCRLSDAHYPLDTKKRA